MSIINKTQDEKEYAKHLLECSVPTYRKAYSDRTAWLMACLSELAYVRFNALFSSTGLKDYFIENVTRLIDEQKKDALLKLIDIVGYDHTAEKTKLEDELKSLEMVLIEPTI